MSDHERRLDKLETIYQRSTRLTPAQERECRAACAQVAAERGLDPDEVWAEAERMIAAEGWPPRSEPEPEATP